MEKKGPGRGYAKHFSASEDAFILANYTIMTYKVLASKLVDRTEKSITDRLTRLSYKKRADYNFVTRGIKRIEDSYRVGHKTEAYNTEEELLSCPFYNSLDLVGEEKAIFNKRL